MCIKCHDTLEQQSVRLEPLAEGLYYLIIWGVSVWEGNGKRRSGGGGGILPPIKPYHEKYK